MTTISLDGMTKSIQAPNIAITTTAETSFVDSDTKLAIRARNICLSYGSSTKINYVLNNLNLNVGKGHIYGLLGPSGCGKTSLLKIISGLTQPESGEVHIFNHKPATKESGVPGQGIGYMPQEIALQSDLTVREMLYYFGRLHPMPTDQLEDEIDFLVNLLEIPDNHRLICNMSGGQHDEAPWLARYFISHDWQS